jgi:hypothetical protein
VHDLWIARCDCNCRPFDWVRDLYEQRRRLGSNTRGYVLKLVLNSLYGKLAQRTGRGPYYDAAAAGLITAITRARLIEAIGQDPEAVAMLATDAVFSTCPLTLDIGEGLGQWEEKIWYDLFIARRLLVTHRLRRFGQIAGRPTFYDWASRTTVSRSL